MRSQEHWKWYPSVWWSFGNTLSHDSVITTKLALLPGCTYAALFAAGKGMPAADVDFELLKVQAVLGMHPAAQKPPPQNPRYKSSTQGPHQRSCLRVLLLHY
eukprot:CAMPEP_0202923340 /NCGR_PEP_ID=MMETSP1392-20130828/78399_1 /ASSEMBLY_ACC=CAM_ASM_000868 /TAXON_ID=225041 /ORGANISM="Chlamydomonas chlamydogama, Strain SAG 11-48b" /LENGTH=101 /DNA_ID=CAMNT_0049617015 /DNA_START=379 /DNA_END=683 /DNA_ORIENTATION=+